MANHRRPISKGKSARSFKRRVGKTAALNTKSPMRGGIRL